MRPRRILLLLGSLLTNVRALHIKPNDDEEARIMLNPEMNRGLNENRRFKLDVDKEELKEWYDGIQTKEIESRRLRLRGHFPTEDYREETTSCETTPLKIQINPDSPPVDFCCRINYAGGNETLICTDIDHTPGVEMDALVTASTIKSSMTAFVVGKDNSISTVNTLADGTVFVDVRLADDIQDEEDGGEEDNAEVEGVVQDLIDSFQKVKTTAHLEQKNINILSNLRVELPRQSFIPQPPQFEVEITLMIVYTKQAMCAEAGLTLESCIYSEDTREPIENLIKLAVQEANIAHDNSKTGVTLKLVHLYGDMTYTEPTEMSEALKNLRINDDGAMDDVHNLRDQHKADLVALIVNFGSGIGHVDVRIGNAFSVANKNYLSGHTLAHEIGHNFGCYHNREVHSENQQQDYAHGVLDHFGDKDYEFRSILAYHCPGQPCPRVNYYAGKDVKYEGQEIGNAENDCARKIREKKHEIAAFYE